jgi:hypothetical protein
MIEKGKRQQLFSRLFDFRSQQPQAHTIFGDFQQRYVKRHEI